MSQEMPSAQMLRSYRNRRDLIQRSLTELYAFVQYQEVEALQNHYPGYSNSLTRLPDQALGIPDSSKFLVLPHPSQHRVSRQYRRMTRNLRKVVELVVLS